MADTKISGLSAVTSLDDEDELVVARAGTTKKVDALHLPGFEIAYAEITSPVTVDNTSEASPDDVVTSGSITYTGVRIRIEFYAYEITVGGTANSFTVVNLWDSSTDLGRIATAGHGTGTQPMSVPVHAVRYLTPSAATHEYRIRAWRVTSNGAIQAGAGGAGVVLPAFIRVTRA